MPLYVLKEWKLAIGFHSFFVWVAIKKSTVKFWLITNEEKDFTFQRST
jgi:hypothetical protein